MQNGKGSKPRPILNPKQYCDNWDQINWKSNKKDNKPKSSNGTVSPRMDSQKPNP